MRGIMKAVILIATLIVASSAQESTTAPPPETTAPPPETTAPPPETTTPPQGTTEAPVTPPSAMNVQVKNGNTVCILISVSSVFEVKYLDENNELQSNQTILPQDEASEVNTTGSCSSPQTVAYMWPKLPEGENDFQNYFRLTFNKNGENYWIEGIDLNLTMTSESFPGYPSSDPAGDLLQFSNSTPQNDIRKDHSYLCKKEETVELIWSSSEENSKNVTVTWIISSIQYQAYQETPAADKVQYETEEDCSNQDKTPLVGPIVVSCVLLALIVVVVVAYVISRKKHATKGKLNSRRSSNRSVGETENKF